MGMPFFDELFTYVNVQRLLLIFELKFVIL